MAHFSFNALKIVRVAATRGKVPDSASPVQLATPQVKPSVVPPCSRVHLVCLPCAVLYIFTHLIFAGGDPEESEGMSGSHDKFLIVGPSGAILILLLHPPECRCRRTLSVYLSLSKLDE